MDIYCLGDFDFEAVCASKILAFGDSQVVKTQSHIMFSAQ